MRAKKKRRKRLRGAGARLRRACMDTIWCRDTSNRCRFTPCSSPESNGYRRPRITYPRLLQPPACCGHPGSNCFRLISLFNTGQPSVIMVTFTEDFFSAKKWMWSFCYWSTAPENNKYAWNMCKEEKENNTSALHIKAKGMGYAR